MLPPPPSTNYLYRKISPSPYELLPERPVIFDIGNQMLFRWMFFWVKYLDVFLAKYQMAHVIHAGSYFLGKKPLQAKADRLGHELREATDETAEATTAHARA